MHHEIEITVRGKTVSAPQPMPAFARGDTVRYFSNSRGQVSIVFPGLSPFRTDDERNTRVAGDDRVTVQRAGAFKSGCRFQAPNEQEIGWPDDPAAGADVKIKD